MSEIPKQYHEVIVVGGGPAGSSAAIHLAQQGISVLLIEQKRFPRAKLCGEFISPECVDHFEKLGVAANMQASEPAEITETVFYSRRGRRLVVPSSWFGGSFALGLSRAEMDNNLLSRAKDLGVNVLEETSVIALIEEQKSVTGVRVRTHNVEREYRASIVVDATGRSRAVIRKLRRLDATRHDKPKLVAFKVHLEGSRATPSTCEIYSYPGGYGGLSTIENGLSNLCFIASAKEVMRAHSKPEEVVLQNLMHNERAAFTLKEAHVTTEWLSVALDNFGRYRPSPASGLLAVGDSAAFIDPFTGSGMLMALEGGELAADVIVRHRNKLNEASGVSALCREYEREYGLRFDARLRLCSLLRRVAFNPLLAQATINVCGISARFRSGLARATRSKVKDNTASASL
jgi:flavin-dependent dehydrogenase